MTGVLLALASAASFALSNNFISRTRTSGGDKGVTFSVLVTMGLSGVLWLMLEAGRVGLPTSAADWRATAYFALAGILAMVFGRTLVFESIRRLGVARSTAVKRLNPFFSVLLATLILAEPVNAPEVAGIVIIALSFAVLVRESLRRRAGTDVPPPPAYLFGVVGALAYALSYIGRKAGLTLMDAPAFGTFVSAASGFAAFAVLAALVRQRRAHFRQMFAHLDRWIVTSAVMVSAGQILLFAALAYESVSTVVMIASLEIFVSIFLSVVVFRSEPPPGAPVLFAAVLATVGVVLVAAN